jgi:hypothetical protein
MEKITVSGMIEAVRSIKGATFATLTTCTVPQMNKTGNPFKNVTKVSEMNCVVGFDYSKAVNRQRTREELEADFLASPRKWGQRADLKTVVHNGKTYLSINPQRVLSVQYFADGKPVDKADLSPWLKEPAPSQTQGTEKEIVYRDVLAENVKLIKFAGRVCEVC